MNSSSAAPEPEAPKPAGPAVAGAAAGGDPAAGAANPAHGPPLVRCLSWIFLGWTLLLWGGTRLMAEATPAATLLLYCPPVLFVGPLPILVLWAALTRDRAALLVQLGALTLVLGPIMGFCLPLRARGPAATAPELRVMSFNVENFAAGAPAVGALVGRAHPDLLLMVAAPNPATSAAPYELLRGVLPGFYEFHAGEFHVASRYPIRPPVPGTHSDSGIAVDIDAPLGQFRLIGVHLGHDRITNYAEYRLRRLLRRSGADDQRSHTANRHREIAGIGRWLQEGGRPAILMGDFNTPPVGPVYREFSAGLTDVFAAVGAGWGFSYPARLPLLRIDQIHVSRHWTPRSVQVGAGGASDHRPLVADLSLTAQHP